MRSVVPSLLSLSLLACAAHATLYTDPAHLPKASYDYLVVGGGTAGSVVAARLTEDPTVSVLVIEAGINNAGVTEAMIPFLGPLVQFNQSLVWNYLTVPQSGLNNRPVFYPRGRLLGGSSSVNFLIYTRGSRDDFDRFANVTGDSAWSWDSIFPYMLRAEGFTAPVDHHNTTGQCNPSMHNTTGLLRTTLPGFTSQLDSRVVASAQADPVKYPFNLDANGGNTVGMSWMQSTSGGGVRSSAATAYLQPALQRSNLDVLINTQVTRLINTAGWLQKPDLRLVECAKSANAPRRYIYARKEVVLSAGAVNTPQILLLSGVGDPKSLSAYGIKTVVNSPGVGQNMQDHPLITNQFEVTSNATYDIILRNATLEQELLTQWATTMGGLFADPVSNQFFWLRLPSNSSIIQQYGDPTPGVTSAHLELLPGNGYSSFMNPTPPANGSFVTIITNVVVPLSRGSLRLKSTNPFDFPAIDPGFMTHPVDVEIMKEAVRTSAALLATEPWKDLAPRPFGPLAQALTTDEALTQYVRNEVVTFWHPSCTAMMGREEDEMAVVDTRLRLKGATGVRIVDASVFPFIPSAHLQAPVYAVAERAVDLIREDAPLISIHI